MKFKKSTVTIVTLGAVVGNWRPIGSRSRKVIRSCNCLPFPFGGCEWGYGILACYLDEWFGHGVIKLIASRRCLLAIIYHADILIAMTMSSDPTAPPPQLPPEAVTTSEVVSEADAEELTAAAEEGRLSIRAKDLAPKIIEKLSAKFGPDIIVKKLQECLEATKTMAVAGRPLEVDDYKTRLDALKLLLQYQVGMPVSRSEVVTHNVDTMHTLGNKMQQSPALRRAIGKMLDNANEADGATPRDVTPMALSEPEEVEAEEVLQSVPESPETPVEVEVRTRTMGEALRSRGKLTPEEKFTR